MDKDKLRIIAELMEELQGDMQPNAEDFDERLGRKPKGLEIVKIEGHPMDDEMDDQMERKEEMLGEDLDGDMEMGEEPEHVAEVMGSRGMEESPDESLKRRLMKLRG